MTLPLNGLRIVDFTNVVMGPYATQVLADYGADVIKIEAPRGDTTRQIPPMRNPDMGTTFIVLNRNKRSVVLDLKTPEGVEALEAIVKTADVFISNVRPQALARLGITYEKLSSTNPRLIWMGLVGFGSTGPYAGRPAYDDLIQGLTAVPDMLTRAGSAEPHYMPISFNDRAVGLHAAIPLLAPVRQRDAEGVGQEVEVPMYETMAQFSLGDHMGGLTFDPPNGPPGYTRTLNPSRRPYKTSDGYICAIIYTDAHWKSFYQAIGDHDRFASDPRVGTFLARTDHAAALYQEVSDAMESRTTDEWLALFDELDIPATRLHTLESATYDPHLEAVGMFSVTEHPTEGRIRQMNVPTSWSRVEFPPHSPAPTLGEHTRDILREVGADDALIDKVTGESA
ncbi:MAG: CoA transferase [Aeromicrobium sp.]|nr:CoA transferase [Aeromicrobium sp.]